MTARSRIFVVSLVAALVGFPPPAGAGEAPAPVYPRGKKDVEVESIRRIWSEAPHNAFPDLCHFQDRWYVSLREGTAHGEHGVGRLRIISSTDGVKWQSVAVFDGFGDYRKGALSVTSDNRLMVMSKFNAFRKAGAADKKRLLKAVDHQGKTHEVVIDDYELRAAFSKDGAEWAPMQAVRGAHSKSWFWSGVQWHKGIGYAIDRRLGANSSLYRTKDGLNFEFVSTDIPAGNESRHSFLPDGTMIAFFRDGSLATSPPPYQKWTLNAANKGGIRGIHSHGGPMVLALANGDVWAACRYSFPEGQGFDIPTKSDRLDTTALFKLVGDKLVPKVVIPGGGDRGYNGLAWRDGCLWMAYMAPAPESGGKSSIFFAKIKLAE